MSRQHLVLDTSHLFVIEGQGHIASFSGSLFDWSRAWGLTSSDSLPLFLSSLLCNQLFLSVCFFFCTLCSAFCFFMRQLLEYTSFLLIKKKKKLIDCVMCLIVDQLGVMCLTVSQLECQIIRSVQPACSKCQSVSCVHELYKGAEMDCKRHAKRIQTFHSPILL